VGELAIILPSIPITLVIRCNLAGAQIKEVTMPKKTAEISIEQAEVNALNEEFKAYIEGLQREWLRTNNRHPKGEGLYELDPKVRARVDGVVRRWQEYITPIAEEWWKQRGLGIIWPEKSDDPCQLYKLEPEAA
jgi:hypothetical protein